MAIVGAVLAAMTLAACGSGDDGARATSTTAPGAVPRDFSRRGPYSVGVSHLQLEGGRAVEVFYPVERAAVSDGLVPFGYRAKDFGMADEVWPLAWSATIPDAWVDAPASTDGEFPVVIFSHGWASTRFSSSKHDAHLASWGFVVAVPQHPSRDLAAKLRGQDTLPPGDPETIGDTIDLLDREAERPGGALSGRLDMDQVAVEGHSAGGRDAIRAASSPRVDTWISLAGTPPLPGDVAAPPTGFDVTAALAKTEPPDKASMVLVAENDATVSPVYSRSVYEWLDAPKRFVVLADTGHVVFLDGCRPFQQGRLDGLVEAFGMDPASETVIGANNGCRPDDASADAVADVWNHLVVAQLDSVFGIDEGVADASLDADYLEATFPGRIEQYLTEG